MAAVFYIWSLDAFLSIFGNNFYNFLPVRLSGISIQTN